MRECSRNIVISAAIAAVLAGALFMSPSFGETKEAAAKDEGGKFLSRAEVARLISATDFLKKKIGQLLSWSIGYDISSVSRAKLVPSIRYIKAQPIKVPPDGRTVISLLVAVDDPGGLSQISGVRADLSGIGWLPNMALVDNGLWGDTSAGDGIYTLQTSVKTTVPSGKKEIAVAVANSKGWLALSRTSLDVEKNPFVVWARATPSSVKSGANVLLEAACGNPGKREDIKKVSVDLSGIGNTSEASMKDDGKGADKKAGDGIFSLKTAIAAGISAGEKRLQVKVVNALDGEGFGEISLSVMQ